MMLTLGQQVEHDVVSRDASCVRRPVDSHAAGIGSDTWCIITQHHQHASRTADCSSLIIWCSFHGCCLQNYDGKAERTSL